MPSKTLSSSNSARPGSIAVSVIDAGGRQAPIGDAYVAVFEMPASAAGTKFNVKNWEPPAGAVPVAAGRTDGQGRIDFDDIPAGEYLVFYGQYPVTPAHPTPVEAGCQVSVCLHPEINGDLTTVFKGPDCQELPCERPRVGDQVFGHVTFKNDRDDEFLQHVDVVLPPGANRVRGQSFAFSLPLRGAGVNNLPVSIRLAGRGPVPASGGGGAFASLRLDEDIPVDERLPSPVSGALNVSMTRTETEPTSDLQLWGAINASTDELSFNKYDAFMELLFCGEAGSNARQRERARFDQLVKRRFLPFTDTDAYRVMKAATEAFVMVNCGVVPTDDERGDPAVLADFRSYLDRRDLPRPGRAPYLENVEGVRMLPYLAIIRRKLPDVPIRSILPDASTGAIEVCDAFIEEKLRNPCLLELIWSYWQEEAMLVQSMNAISRRFQNVRGVNDPDPLVNLEVNPLRPLNSLLWGYVQDEQHRLTVARRNGEYDHHYGLRLEGRAVQGFRGADSRSKFVEAFHHLLRLCVEFYKQDDDTTVKADAFGVLNALKEVHLILSLGAHSQFGELPPTARIEMMMQQWLLARPEFREFLPSRSMVAYPERWMDPVDSMKKLMGWTETSVIHFHNLAVFGEKVLLAIRYGAWSTVFEPTQAFNFARFWRPQIQGYIHAYRAATGVELGAAAVTQQVDTTLPSLLLQRRLSAQRRSA